MRLYHLAISLILFLLFISSNLNYAQPIKRVKGESQVKIESHLSENEAKEIAAELAMIDALTNAFGQYVEQESNINLESGKVNFRSYGQVKVKGEWIRTIGEPVFNFYSRNQGNSHERWIKCEIKGEGRKAGPKANIEVETLSCPRKNCRTSEFFSEENMYMYIKSPVDGFVSIYLDDGEMVYRLFPYRRMITQKSVRIEGDKEYILFSKDITNFEISSDKLELFTNRDEEVNTLIIVFSENEYQKPLLSGESADEKGLVVPKSLSKKEFEKWLGDCRAEYPDFLDLKRRIKIAAK